MVLNGEMLNLSSEIGNRPRMFAFTICIRLCSRGSCCCIEARRRNKRHLNWRKVVKFSLFTDNISEYLKNSMESSKSIVELTSEFSMNTRYTGNIQKLYSVYKQ